MKLFSAVASVFLQAVKYGTVTKHNSQACLSFRRFFSFKLMCSRFALFPYFTSKVTQKGESKPQFDQMTPN